MVATVYDMLIAEGPIEAEHGSGTFVTREAAPAPPPAGPAAGTDRRLPRLPETYSVAAAIGTLPLAM